MPIGKNRHFQETDWFSYKDENTWHPITTTRAAEVLEMNKEEELPESLAVDRVEVDLKDTKINSDLERMDARFKKKDYRKNTEQVA